MPESLTFEVKVAREGQNWTAEVVGLSGAITWAQSLRELDIKVAEVISLVAELDEAESPRFDYLYEGDALGADQIVEAKAEAEATITLANMAEAKMTRELVAKGWSKPDVAQILQLSDERLKQILRYKK